MKTILGVLLFLSIYQSAIFKAKVIGVKDGDTIVVLTEGNKQLTIRLEGIDCPEKFQDFGSKAKEYTVQLCFSKDVKVEKTGVDKYDRTLAKIYVDGLCINEELLKAGMAWHYKKYNTDTKLAELEKDAHRSKIGLWSLPNPTPPWDFRKKK